jgi:hypothetical protein
MISKLIWEKVHFYLGKNCGTNKHREYNNVQVSAI